MILLTSTSDFVQVVTTGTQTINVHADWVDLSGSTVTPGRLNTIVTTATTTNVVTQPAVSTERNVKTLFLTNTSATTAENITVQHTDGTNVVVLAGPISLQPGNTLTWTEGAGWSTSNTLGQLLQNVAQGVAAALANAWPIKITDATNGPAAVKPGGTAPVAGDAALVVTVSPNSGGGLTTVNQGNPNGTANQGWWTRITDSSGDGPVAVKGANASAGTGDPSLVVALSPNSPGAQGAPNATASNGWWMRITDSSGDGPVAVKGANSPAGTGDPALVVAMSPNSPPAQGTPAALGNAWPIKITDASSDGPATVKGANTAAASGDNALVVALSPNNAPAQGLPNATATNGWWMRITDSSGDGPVAVKGASAPAGNADPALVVAMSPNSPPAQGTPAALGNAWPIKITDASSDGPAAVKPASTAAGTGDPSLVVALSPNSNTVFSKITDASGDGPATVKPGGVAATSADASLVVALNPNSNTVLSKITDASGDGPAAVKGANTAAGTGDPALVVALSPNSPGAQGAPNATASNGWWMRITDSSGDGPAAVKGANTPPGTGDPALVVSISPNSPASALAGTKSVNSAAPGANNLGAFPAQANVAAPTWSEGYQNPLSVDLSGYLRVLDKANGSTGAAAPATALQVAGSDGTNLVALRVKDASTAAVAADPAVVVALSPNTPTPGVADGTSTGPLGALNASVQVSTAGLAAAGFQLAAGTFVGTLIAESSTDGGTTWNGTNFYTLTGGVLETLVFTTNNAAVAGTLVAENGASLYRVRALAYSSGTANITLRATTMDTSTLPVLQMIASGVGNVDVFGGQVASFRSSQIQIPFYSAAPASLLTITTTGSGVAAQGTGVATFSSGTTAGSEVKGVTPTTLQYAPQNELFGAFTAAFTTGIASSYQRVGPYNTTDGFSFGYNGTTFGLWTRFNSADTFVAQTAWNQDTLSGTSNSKFTSNGIPVALTSTDINIFRVRYGWLGASSVLFEVYSPDGAWVLVHVARFANSGSTAVSMTNPNVPITVDVSNSAGGTNLVVTCGCWVGGSTGAPSLTTVANGQQAMVVIPGESERPTYSISLQAAASGTTNTDVFTLIGSATKVVRVTRVRFSMTTSTAVTIPLQLIKRSTASSGGTSAPVAASAYDSNDPAATATNLAYTVNATSLGTIVGTPIRSDKYFAEVATPTTGASDVIEWDFGTVAKQPTLRGTAQSLCINLGGATIAGGSISATFEFTEDNN